MEIAALGLRVDGVGNIDQAATSLGRFTQSAGSAEKSAGALAPASTKASKTVQELGKSSGSTSSSLNSLGSTATKVGGVLAAAFSVTKVIQYADAWSDMQSRVGAATGNMDLAAGQMQRLLQIANASYSPLEQTSAVYARNVATFRDLGRSAAEAADFTEAVNNALVTTATRGEDAEVVIGSLSRSLAKGKLDADAFDTIVSRSPRTLKAVADQMGVTTSSLRKLASEGKVTGNIIATGLTKALDDLRAEAAEMPATMGDAFVRVGNNVTAFVGIMDQATGASGELANSIIGLSDSALEFATSEDVIAGFVAWQGTISAIAQDFIKLDGIISDFASNTTGDVDEISFSFGEMPANIRAMIQIATVEIASFIDAQMNGIKALGAAIEALPNGPSAAVDAFNAVRAQMSQIGEIREELIFDILNERDAIIQAGRDAAKSYEETNRKALEFTGTVAAVAGATVELTKEQKKSAKALADFRAQSAMSLANTLALTEAYLANAGAVAAVAREQKIEAEVLKLGEQNRAAVTQRINEMEDALESLDLAKSIAQMRDQNKELTAYGKVLALGGKATEAGRAALAKYNSEREIEAALVGKTSAEVKKLIPILREEQKVRDSLRQGNDRIERLNDLVAETRTVTEKANEELRELAELANSTQDPKYLDAINRKIKEVQASTSEWGQFTARALDSVDQAFADAWKNIDQGFSGFADGLKNAFKNLLAELAHMAITRPIIMQFASALGIGGGTQGNNGIWGSLLGGGSSSNGGLDLGTLLSYGQTIYSAATGWGPAAYAGFQSGGIGGALSGVGNFYGGMIGNATSTVGGWLGGSAAGSAAAQAASSAAAQQAGMAAGNSLAVNAGAYGTTGAAAGSGGMFSGMAGLASNPIGWIIAAAISGYQGSKMYEQGLRADSSAIMGQTDSGLGKAFLSVGGPAFNAKIHEWMDSAFRGLGVGDKALSWLGAGGSIHQSLWGPDGVISKALFGGSWKTKDTGFGLSVRGGELEAQQYQDMKKKGGLFSSSKKKTVWGDVSPEAEAILQGTYDSTKESVESLFQQLGISVEDSALSGLNIARAKISAKGKTDEEIQQAIADWFGATAEAMNTELNRVLGTGLDYDLAGMQSFVANLQGVNVMLASLDLAMYDSSVAGGKLAESLSAIGGGLENLATNAGTYYGAFFTDAEKLEDTIDSIKRAFESADLELVQSREAYREMVEAIDLASESGQEMFAKMMVLAGHAAQYFDIIEAQAAQAAQAAAQLLANNVSSAFGSLQRSASVERDRLTKNYQAQIAAEQAAAAARSSAYADMISTSRAGIQAMSGLDSALKRALKTLLSTSDTAVEMMRQQAVATLQSALQMGRAGKPLTGIAGLEDAIDTASRVDTDVYGTLADFEREQGRTANIIAELEAINGKQLTAQEKLLAQLEASFSGVQNSLGGISAAITAEYERAIKALDDELAAAQSQLDALNGIDNSVQSVANAVTQMSAAVTAAMGGQEAAIQQLYRSISGSSANQEGVNFWLDRIGEGGSYTELIKELQQASQASAGHQNAIADLYKQAGTSADAQGIKFWTDAIQSGKYDYDDLRAGLGIKAFATGGAFTNGVVSGPTAFNMGLMGEAGSEGILPLANVGGRLGVHANMGDNSAELQATRAELAEIKRVLVEIMWSSKETATATRNMDESGVVIDTEVAA